VIPAYPIPPHQAQISIPTKPCKNHRFCLVVASLVNVTSLMSSLRLRVVLEIVAVTPISMSVCFVMISLSGSGLRNDEKIQDDVSTEMPLINRLKLPSYNCI